MSKIYDVIILGAGPAGLAAGLYAGRSRLSTLIIEKGQDGGQIAITNEIENYPRRAAGRCGIRPQPDCPYDRAGQEVWR
jgi:thioredoxin reductase